MLKDATTQCIKIFLSYNLKGTYRSRHVGDSLCPAIGQSHLVSSIGIVTITLLMGIEVGGGVVVLDSVGVLVHWGEVGVGGLSGVGGGSGRGSAGTGQEGS